YAALKDWAVANGLRISQESSARTALTVRGSVGQFQTLFETKLDIYQTADGKQFYSARLAPTIPSAIASQVDGVMGLTNSIQYAPLAKIGKIFGESPITPGVRTDTAGGTGPGGAYAASDLRTAYGIPSFGGVAPQTVAVFEQGGFFKSDVAEYIRTMNLPTPDVKFVSVNGYNGEVNDAGVELEAVLDIDMVIGINPAVSSVLVYEDGNDSFQVAIIDALQQVASDNKAQTLSISYGLDEVQQGNAQLKAENSALTQLAAQGITVLVSSGDDGAYGRTGTSHYPAHLEAPDPGSQPLVTCVGGTSLFTAAGQVYDGETVWNELGAGWGATGGGVSSYWSIPAYQAPIYVSNNGGSTTKRNVPDVAAVADPLAGVAVYSRINGGWLQIGGTSVSAPLWAGYISIINAGAEFLLGEQIGQFNPLLYSIEWNSVNEVPSYYLYGIFDGTNGNAQLYGTPGYNAGNFNITYCNCCGNGTPWGGIFAWVALQSLATGGAEPGTFFIDPISAQSTSATLSWTPSRGATGYVVATYYSGPYFTYSTAYVTKEQKLKLTGLVPATIYDVFVTAVYRYGYSTVLAAFITK
ncbi:MAG: protease pro-enzyme activation domain-containing protein, partial [Chthoniobacterales bacterium]